MPFGYIYTSLFCMQTSHSLVFKIKVFMINRRQKDNRACMTLHSNTELFTSTIEPLTHIHPTEDTQPWNTGAFKLNPILFPYQVMHLYCLSTSRLHTYRRKQLLFVNYLIYCYDVGGELNEFGSRDPKVNSTLPFYAST